MAALNIIDMYSGEYDKIDLLPNQILMVECATGKQRKYWHHFAEKRNLKHISVYCSKFYPVQLYLCKICGHAEYFCDMPLNCCEYDSEVRYCRECDDEEGCNIINITNAEDYTGPDADFKKISERMLNCVMMGAELPNIHKKYRRKRNRYYKNKTEDDNIERDYRHRMIICDFEDVVQLYKNPT